MDHMKLYLSLLTLYENNMRILHWKLAGNGFHMAHERFAGYYETLGDYMDEAAEQMITLGGNPVGVNDAIGVVRDSDVDAFLVDPNKNYTGEEANEAAYKMFNQLYGLAKEVDDVPDDVEDVFIGHMKYYRIEGMYKLRRTDTPAQQQEEPTITVAEDPDDTDGFDD